MSRLVLIDSELVRGKSSVVTPKHRSLYNISVALDAVYGNDGVKQNYEIKELQ
jgi:hypothetical protein